MIRGIKFVNIPIQDQARALAFYTEKLGFKVATDQEMAPGGPRWIELRIPGADTGVTLFTPDGHADRIGTFQPISFWSDDVEATYEVLRARGVVFQDPPKKEKWGTSVIFEDSEGNKLHIGSR
jgi:catechol 2,3-dioxygenase-like lactoylglutathione lyase family enzyme